MPRIVALALVMLAVAVPVAEGATGTPWRVTGELAGTYANTQGWRNCDDGTGALLAEHVDVSARLESTAVARYVPGSTSFLTRGRLAPNGSWSLTGTFPERVIDEATGDVVCRAPVSVACRGPLELGGDPPVRLTLLRTGSSMVGRFNRFPALFERRGGSSVAPICTDDPMGTRISPLFGVGGRTWVSKAWLTTIRVPISRLAGRRAFTVRGTATHPGGQSCSASYTPCTERGQLRLTLTFRRAG